MKEEQRLKRITGGFSPSLTWMSGLTSRKQVAGNYWKLVGKRLRGWLSLVGSGDR
jgi:hypothetical protein